MFESIQEVNGQIVNNQWIEWDHAGVPNKPKEFRDIIRFILSLLCHCMNCTTIDGCYFIERQSSRYMKDAIVKRSKLARALSRQIQKQIVR